MLSRQYRLTRGSLFSKTMASGKTLCRTPYFVLLALPRRYASATPTRFGFIVSRKVSNKATRRNKVRRRLREIVRCELLAGNLAERLAPYIAMVFVARGSALQASHATLREALLYAIACLPVPRRAAPC
jgi:ribonuclease P protein component